MPPTAGTPQSQMWANNSALVGDLVAAGAFETAMQNMHRQIGIVKFEPFKDAFMLNYAHSRVVVPGLPSSPCMTFYPHRNFKDAGPRRIFRLCFSLAHCCLDGLPAQALTLADLIARRNVRFVPILDYDDSCVACRLLSSCSREPNSQNAWLK